MGWGKLHVLYVCLIYIFIYASIYVYDTPAVEKKTGQNTIVLYAAIEIDW